ncbi:putative C-type lectin domain family 20 member A isoform X2 [Centroberyx affinis]|uniref:putative C-type lectin domain family 20 member A isoform X2 n=1 Tax=Centroberyx affinis TaxID=166261 RepID=UPI003A5BA999
MEITVVFLLLCSACFYLALPSSHLRVFFLVERKNRIDALQLYGVPFTFNASVVTLGTGDQICEAMDKNTWKGFNCSDRIPFMCYNKTDEYILIEKKKNWCQAQKYCRTHYTDLVSISNQTQNQEVIQMGKNRTFWIGLLHDEWEWEDKTCSTFRHWMPIFPSSSSPRQHGSVLLSFSDIFFLLPFAVDNESSGLCSKGNTRIRVINQTLTWEKAFDYCTENHKVLLWINSPSDQEAVEQWLNHTEVSGPLWLGLRQSHLFGFWIWANESSSEVVEYNKWKNGTVPELPLSHHCGAIAKEDDYMWSDKDCRLQLPFLCEEDMN